MDVAEPAPSLKIKKGHDTHKSTPVVGAVNIVILSISLLQLPS